MAFKIQQGKKLDNVILVSEYDDALDLDAFDWDDYTDDYDFSKLSFLPEKCPTKFVCNFRFNADELAEIKNSTISSVKNNNPQISLGSWQQNITRYGLKDVVYDPEDKTAQGERLTIKKSGKYISDYSLATLEDAGIVSEIFTAYNVLTSKDKTIGKEKN